MRILKITEHTIEFDNGKDISFEHDQECCEINYADFEQLDSLARDEDQKRELGVMLSKLDNTLRKLKQGFELSGNSE